MLSPIYFAAVSGVVARKRNSARFRARLGLVLAALCVQVADAQPPPAHVVFGGDAAYPPFEWQQGRVVRGFDIELEDAIARLGGADAEHVLGNWPDTIRALESGQVDVVAMFQSNEREHSFLFTPPFHFVNHGVFARADFPNVSSVEELAGQTIAVEELSYAYQKMTAERFPATLVPTSNTFTALEAVASGKANYAILAAPTASYLIRDHALNVRNVGPPLWPMGYAFAVRKDRPDLAQWLTSNYYAALRTGAYQSAYEDWEHELGPTPEGVWSRWLKLATVPLSLLVLGGLVWAYRMRRVLASRTRGLVAEMKRRRAAESHAQWANDHDAYTELPRLHLFSSQVAERLVRLRSARTPEKQVVALKLADLDRTIRTLGHEAGLALTRDFARRLRAMRFEVYGQSGRDVFLAFGDQAEIAAKLRGVVSPADTIVIDDPTPRFFAGASTWPGDGKDLPNLLRRAETALAMALEKREPWVEYKSSMEPDQDDLNLLSAFRKRGSRELYGVFQPQIDIHTGEIVGAEALVRWDAPGIGPVSPGRFIPLLEDAGLVGHVTTRMLQESVRIAAELRRSGHPCPISVNVTVGDLLSEKTRRTIFDALHMYGGVAADLQLELTESSVAERPDGVRWVIARLRDDGIRTSIDDFGTGYSSLSYLSEFPIHELKIDRSFVGRMSRRAQDHSIVRATIAMAHEMNLLVVAEGVETETELHMLREDGCDRVQGFLISKPLRESDLVRFVRTVAQLDAARAMQAPAG